MIFYYLLLILMPFYEYVHLPKIGESFTTIKMVGILAMVAAWVKMIGVIHPLTVLRWAETRLFFLLAGIATASVLFFSSHATEEWTAAVSQQTVLVTIYAIASYLFITLIFVDSMERLRRVCYVTIFSMGLAALSVFNDYYRWNSPRPGGVAGDSNYFALEALAVLPLAFTLPSAAKTKLAKLFLVGTGLFIIAAILLGASRGGFIGLAASFLYFTIRTRRLRFLLLSSMAGLLLALILPQSPVRRFLEPGTAEDMSVSGRIEILKAGVNMVKAHPFTGVGLGLYKPLSRSYNADLDASKIAHNTYLELAAELGTPAVIVFLLILFFSWRRARKLGRICKEKANVLGAGMALAVEVGVVGAAASAVFLSAEWVRHMWLLIFLGVALQRLLYIEDLRVPVPVIWRSKFQFQHPTRLQTGTKPVAPAAGLKKK